MNVMDRLRANLAAASLVETVYEVQIAHLLARGGSCVMKSLHGDRQTEILRIKTNAYLACATRNAESIDHIGTASQVLFFYSK